MTHLLAPFLTKVAVAVLEAIVMRLLIQLWKTYTAGRRPAATAA
ncbi:hypothetical protein [Streptomyces spongiae]|nr:hypothetical protein [Streptomyces spongiae]